MNKKSLILLMLLLTGCSNIEGYIVDKEEGRILVVSPEATTYGDSNNSIDHYPAVWISTNDKKYELGQKVKAYYENIEESYPGQAKAERITSSKSTKPRKAGLSEKDVIQVLLNNREDLLIPVIKEITYHSDGDYWDITVVSDSEELYFQIEDN